jgi:hypothetical protein
LLAPFNGHVGQTKGLEVTDEEGRHIPVEIQRQVLLEAGHGCAIPTCQFHATEFAHIEPFREVKKHEASNIIALCPNHHTLYDQKKTIDRKAMRAYKLKLQFLNKRYTSYELRLLALLGEKPYILASGEIEVLGLLKDGLIENAHTFETQSLVISKGGKVVHQDLFVQAFAARLTAKGKTLIETWKSQSEDLLAVL